MTSVILYRLSSRPDVQWISSHSSRMLIIGILSVCVGIFCFVGLPLSGFYVGPETHSTKAILLLPFLSSILFCLCVSGGLVLVGAALLGKIVRNFDRQSLLSQQRSAYRLVTIYDDQTPPPPYSDGATPTAYIAPPAYTVTQGNAEMAAPPGYRTVEKL